jgi:undecaprenyl-diphosphatase
MVDALIDLAARLGTWGYLVIFAAAVLEASAFLGLVVPGETIVIASGFLAWQGLFDVRDVIIVATIGAIIGDSIGYELGRHFGRPWLLSHGRYIGLTPRRVRRVDAFFERHGGKAVLLGRFVGIVRALAHFISSTSQEPSRRKEI